LRTRDIPACTPACTDPGLSRLLDAWPNLPDHIRRAILTLADGSG
jgi:hypothetical protein